MYVSSRLNGATTFAVAQSLPAIVGVVPSTAMLAQFFTAVPSAAAIVPEMVNVELAAGASEGTVIRTCVAPAEMLVEVVSPLAV